MAKKPEYASNVGADVVGGQVKASGRGGMMDPGIFRGMRAPSAVHAPILNTPQAKPLINSHASTFSSEAANSFMGSIAATADKFATTASMNIAQEYVSNLDKDIYDMQYGVGPNGEPSGIMLKSGGAFVKGSDGSRDALGALIPKYMNQMEDKAAQQFFLAQATKAVDKAQNQVAARTPAEYDAWNKEMVNNTASNLSSKFANTPGVLPDKIRDLNDSINTVVQLGQTPEQQAEYSRDLLNDAVPGYVDVLLSMPASPGFDPITEARATADFFMNEYTTDGSNPFSSNATSKMNNAINNAKTKVVDKYVAENNMLNAQHKNNAYNWYSKNMPNINRDNAEYMMEALKVSDPNTFNLVRPKVTAYLTGADIETTAGLQKRGEIVARAGSKAELVQDLFQVEGISMARIKESEKAYDARVKTGADVYIKRAVEVFDSLAITRSKKRFTMAGEVPTLVKLPGFEAEANSARTAIEASLNQALKVGGNIHEAYRDAMTKEIDLLKYKTFEIKKTLIDDKLPKEYNMSIGLDKMALATGKDVATMTREDFEKMSKGVMKYYTKQMYKQNMPEEIISENIMLLDMQYEMIAFPKYGNSSDTVGTDQPSQNAQDIITSLKEK